MFGPRSLRFLGFGYGTGVVEVGGNLASYPFRVIWFPHWFLALLFAVLPALRLRSILRTRRLNRVGVCERCGYDLRATPARCPECGHVPTGAAVTS
jgi:hypothetical protein